MARRDWILSTVTPVLLAFMMAFVMPGDSSDSTDAKILAAPEPSVLKIGFMGYVDSLNPYVGFSDAAYAFYSLVYDSLICVGNDLEAAPNLATSWYAVPTTDPDLILSGEPYGSVWQYNISANARWSDGEPFTADDVVWNFNLNAGNYTTLWAFQPYAYFMKYAEKVGDYEVRVHFYDRETGLSMPAAYAGSISMPMLPKHKLQSMTAMYIGFNWQGNYSGVSTGIVGTGPFMGTSTLWDDWYRGVNITLVKNPDCHWAADYGKTVNFDRIEMLFFDDQMAMTLALKYGDIDVAQFSPQTYYDLKKDVLDGTVSDIETFDGPKITQYWTEVGFNMNPAGPHPSRLDPAIRQAMAMAMDKQYIVDNYYLGLGVPGSTLIPSINMKWHYNLTAGEKFPVDLDAARAMLSSHGYNDTDADGVRECTASSMAVQEGWAYEGEELTYEMLVRREHPEEKDIAQYLKNEWANIGVIVNVMIVDEVTLVTMVYMYQYDTMIWYWSSDIDPNYQLFTQTKAAWNGWSDNKYFNASYDENYTHSVQAMDPAARKVFVDNCQRINYRDAAYLIMAEPNQTYAWRTDTFTGWGDWKNDPGRSLDNFYTGNPLFFDLKPDEKPVASFWVSSLLGDTSTMFEFDASWSSDNETPLADLYVRWDWEGNGVWDTDWTTTKTDTHQFAIPSTYDVTLEVRDSTNKTDQWVIRVLVQDTAIPEFPSLVLPLLGLGAIVAGAAIIRRRRGLS